MINFRKKLSAIMLTTLFMSMQTSYAAINTGLGTGNGGAVINNAQGGFVDVTTGMNSADLNFNGNAHVNWDSLNVNNGESLNFNAVGGSNNLTILNTVNNGMSKIYGNINANQGIGQLIISNPNGVLFDGAHFTTAGDAMITTQNMTGVNLNDLNNAEFTKLYNGNGKLVAVQIKDSDFNVGGNFNIVAAGINAANSTLTGKTVKLVTANGQDYVSLGQKVPTKDDVVTRLSAVTVNGDLYITNDVGALEVLNGGAVNGDMKVLTSGNVILNKENNGKNLNINGNVDVKGNGAQMFLRNANVNGNVRMANGGGFLDLGDAKISGNADLITKDVSTNKMGCKPVKHFVHVIGGTTVGGNLNIDSKDNIHIGGYDYEAQKLADGNLKVGGNLNAHAHDGHVMTTINTSANKITLKSDKLNVLTDGKAVLDAKEYDFSSNGYLGGLKASNGLTVDQKVVKIMENYIPVPDVGTPGNINITGGTISNIHTPSNAVTHISSSGNVKLTGANAGNVNITAINKNVEITGKDVHANEIKVGKETNKLKVDFPNRDYKLKYTNIRDEKEVVINKNDKITYELTNAKNGYNDGVQVAGKSTYLVGPDAPGPEPLPDPPIIDPEDNENIKVLRSFENQSVNLNQVYTPVAYAADLDDDESDTGVRKNVDGSVTVVRAFPMVD